MLKSSNENKNGLAHKAQGRFSFFFRTAMLPAKT
jgi:hypothetical protein